MSPDVQVIERAEGWYWACLWADCGDASGPFPAHRLAKILGDQHVTKRHGPEADEQSPGSAFPTCSTCGTRTALSVEENGIAVYVCRRCLLGADGPG